MNAIEGINFLLSKGYLKEGTGITHAARFWFDKAPISKKEWKLAATALISICEAASPLLPERKFFWSGGSTFTGDTVNLNIKANNQEHAQRRRKELGII
jgi:hypothetical protein